MNQIKEIIYDGYTTVPSDYECPDGDLALATGVLPEDGTLKPVLPAAVRFTLPVGCKVVYIHATSQMAHYIISCYRRNTPPDDPDYKFYWINKADADSATEPILIGDLSEIPGEAYLSYNTINAVGNTLMIMDFHGINYYLWNGTVYKYLGNHIPELPIRFGLNCDMEKSMVYSRVFADVVPVQEAEEGLTNDNKDTFTTEILGKVNKFIREQANRTGKFMYPFLVRYAYRMYDQQLTMHSAPILMVASSDVSPIVPALNIVKVDGMVMMLEYQVAAVLSQLKFQVMDGSDITELEKWGDIIKSVDIFISAPIYTYNQSGYVEKMYVDYHNTYTDSFSVGEYMGNNEFTRRFAGMMYEAKYETTLDDVVPIPKFSAEAVKGKIRDCHDFYLLTSVKVDNLDTNWNTISVEEDYLDSLQTREVMTDDYDSHDNLIPDYSYNYNSRLNIANITKELFRGFEPGAMMGYTYKENYTSNWVSYVHIKQDYKEIVVRSDSSVLLADNPVLMLYYPNPNAYKITLYNGITRKEYPLEAHDFLNGAFYFQGWDYGGTTVYDSPAVTSDKTVNMPNKIYTSEVNNPFLFLSSGVNTVGIGEIKGMASAVRPLSEGQFGDFPMYAFSTEGVWALKAKPDGTFVTSQPVTRDVIINPESLTQLDSAVLFSTERGIMLISGSNSKCISDNLQTDQTFEINMLPPVAGQGETNKILALAGLSADETTILPFKEFLQTCRMLYDYTGQRIIVYHPDQRYAYVYSLKTNKWGMAPSNIQSGFNSYPEALVNSSGDDEVVVEDWSNPDEAAESNGLIVTRPLKLDHPNDMKTIRTIVQRGKFAKGNVKQILWGSRDLMHWYLVGSSVDHYLRGISGTPYKYFRLGLPVSLPDGESLYGCTVMYEVKETNKLR